MTTAPTIEKQCTRCKATKALEGFKPISCKTGRAKSWCKTCDIETQRWRRNQIVNRACGKCGTTYQCRNGSSKYCVPCGKDIRMANIAKGPRMRLECEHCHEIFPSDRASKRFCSLKCKYTACRGRKKKTVSTTKARAAQSIVANEIRSGRLTRPVICEQCGENRKIEAAHYDYDWPLLVRWLCIPCHRRWDKSEPKGGAQSVSIHSGIVRSHKKVNNEVEHAA